MTYLVPDFFKRHAVANRLEGRKLLIAVNIVAGLSIFFFGYDQGVLGGVNTNRNYASIMKFGYYDEAEGLVKVTKPLLQGGIVAVYYLPGTLVGALWGGWLGDRYGRITTIGFGCLWSMVGASLQCSAQNHDWMFCARTFNGIGTGILNAITPVWATETTSHKSRGAFVSLEFTLNIFGVVVAYWLEYGTSFYFDKDSSFIWRFPIAFQIVPLIVLFFVVWFMPESPRWLVKEGRNDEALYILQRLRGSKDDTAQQEYDQIISLNDAVLETEGKKYSYLGMLFGTSNDNLHLARRVQLVVWLQILQEWIGIAGITIYGPEIFTLAGVSAKDRQWVAGLNDITYMAATLICVFTLDRIGRRWTLYWGAVGQGICCFCAGGLAYAAQHATGSNKIHIGGATVFFVFLYTMIFGATWLTVPWLYPAEIFPLQVRARGNAWGVVGWSIGNGWCVLLLPTIFARVGVSTLYIFGGVNALSIVIVWAFYPETSQRTLEEINLLFACDSIWTWETERMYAQAKSENAYIGDAIRSASIQAGRKHSVLGITTKSETADHNEAQTSEKE